MTAPDPTARRARAANDAAATRRRRARVRRALAAGGRRGGWRGDVIALLRESDASTRQAERLVRLADTLIDIAAARIEEGVAMTRDAWLAAAVDLLRPWFTELGKPLPARLRVQVGYAGVPADAIHDSTGAVCSPPDGAGVVHIAIGVHLDSAMPRPPNCPYGVLETLVHECVHAAVGTRHGHSRVFRRLAERLGLEVIVACGRRRVESPNAALRARLAEISLALGPYPEADAEHATLRRVLGDLGAES